MKRLCLLLAFTLILFANSLAAQSASLVESHTTDVKIRTTGMVILGVWAIGNMLVGGIGRSRFSGEKAYFHEMNLFWNIVNLAIAGAGYYFTTAGDLPLSGAEQLASQIRFQKILLFNSGLDIAYIIGGLYLIEKAKHTSKKSVRIKGYGKSIMLQGVFLFIFDLVLYTIHQNKTTPLVEWIGY